MGFLKRTNKKFDYQPRYYKGEGSPFKIEHKLDKFRKTAGKNKGLKSKFTEAIGELKSGDKGVNKTIMYIIIILVLVFLYIIDFDVSIFYSK
ncbi:MAG: riboflavin synthase subunit beta [Polaribacter sp.]|uniref:riboflavin synthase subunit beta n=1 Tax=Polaribacter sp. TaxID=1920175 RepID=UPI003BAF5647